MGTSLSRGELATKLDAFEQAIVEATKPLNTPANHFHIERLREELLSALAHQPAMERVLDESDGYCPPEGGTSNAAHGGRGMTMREIMDAEDGGQPPLVNASLKRKADELLPRHHVLPHRL